MRVLVPMKSWSLFFFLLTLFSVTASKIISTDVSIKYDEFEKIIKEELSPIFQKDLNEWIQSLPSTSANPTDVIKSGDNINLKLPLPGDLDKFVKCLITDKYQGSTFKNFLDSLKSTNSYCNQNLKNTLPKHKDILFNKSVLAGVKFEKGKYVEVKSHDSYFDYPFSILFDNLYLSYDGSAKTFRESFSNFYGDYSKLNITGTSKEDVLTQFCSKIEPVVDPNGSGKITLPELISEFEKFKITNIPGQFKLVYDESKSNESLKREDLLKNEAFYKLLFNRSRINFLQNFPEYMEFFLYVSEQNNDINESNHLLKIFDLIKNNIKTLSSEFLSKNLVLKENSIDKFKSIVIDSIFDNTLFSKISGVFKECGIFDGIVLKYKFLSLPYTDSPDNSVRDYIKWVVQDIKSPNETDVISGLETSLKSRTIENYKKHLEASNTKVVIDKSTSKQKLKKNVSTNNTKSKATPKPKGKIITIIIIVGVVGVGVMVSVIVAVIYIKKRKENFDEKDAQGVKQF